MHGGVSTRSGVAWLGALLASGWLASCSTLSPQVFSERYSGGTCGLPNPQQDVCPKPRPPGPVPLEAAIADAEALQARYLIASRELSESSAGSSAALIALSALGLYKGVTSARPGDLAAIGVLGSTAYVWGSSMTSKPRQQAFDAGARTVGCALAQARAYRMVDSRAASASQPANSWFSDAGSAEMSLDALRRRAETQIVSLDRQTQILRPLNEPPPPETGIVLPPNAQRCVGAERSPCTAPGPSAEAGERKLFALCQRNHPRCMPRLLVTIERVPDPRIAYELKHIAALRRHLSQLARTASEQSMIASKAGDVLWDRTVEIQSTVADEVLKTEPDIDKVKSLAQGMRATAFSITSAPAFAPPAASAASDAASSAAEGQSGERNKSAAAPAAAASALKIPERHDAEIDAARDAEGHAMDAAQALGDKLVALQASVANAAKALQACTSDNASPNRLKVVPSITELTLAPGAEASFTVSGGVGSPGTNLTPRSGQLTRHDDTNHTTFDYTADPAAAEGSKVILSFIDGSSASTDVTITISGEAVAKAGAGSTASGTVPTPSLMKELAPQLGIDAAASNLSVQFFKAAEDCMRGKLHIANPDAHTLDDATLTAIRAGKCQ